jgi:hypothetical protein
VLCHSEVAQTIWKKVHLRVKSRRRTAGRSSPRSRWPR